MYAILLLCCQTTAAVEAKQPDPQVRFVRDVVPALSSAGCNNGNCHGSLRKQQNGGFRLSLFGSRPVGDYVAIADGPRGPLIDEKSAEKSRLLRIAVGELKHFARKRLSSKSPEFKVLRSWIAQGAPPPATEHVRVRLRVVPSHITSQPGRSIRFRVLAVDSEKRERNVTAWCRVRVEHRDGTDWKREANGRFRVTGHGRFKIVAHYGGRAAVATVDVPYTNTAAEFKWSADDPVDRTLSERWTQMGLQPAAAVDDAKLTRRMYLHLIGRRPTYAELSAIVKSNRPDKRSRLIDILLSHPEHARHWADEWHNWLALPKGRLTAKEHQALTDWLRNMLNDNASALLLAKRLITASGKPDENGAVAFRLAFQSEQERTEANVRVFLGVNVRCFRCHDHPRSKWRVDDYHALVACFAGESVTRSRGHRRVVFRRTRYRHPETAAVLHPAVFGEAVKAKSKDTRAAFVEWMVRDKKQRFARTIVNRYWTALFGEGLVDDDDDSFPDNPSPHTELLNALARDFVEHGYDVKYLLHRLCSARIYRFGSKRPNKKVMFWRGEFARRQPQLLPPHVLLRQLAYATGVDPKQVGLTVDHYRNSGHRRRNSPKTGFQPGRCDLEPNDKYLGSALVLINSSFLSDLIRHSKGRAARLAASKTTDAAILDELFQVTLARQPTGEERARCLNYWKKILKEKGTRRQTVEDILWALINSKEFLFNN